MSGFEVADIIGTEHQGKGCDRPVPHAKQQRENDGQEDHQFDAEEQVIGAGKKQDTLGVCRRFGAMVDERVRPAD